MKKQILFSVAILANFAVNAQGIKMGNVSNINPNSALEIEATNKGLLIPRLPLVAITNPAPLVATVPDGMLVFNNGTSIRQGFYYWSSNRWNLVADSASQAASINAASLAASTGYFALNNTSGLSMNTNGSNNTAVGQYSFSAGQNNTAAGNTAVSIGQTNQAGGQYATAIGQNNNASALNATAIGYNNPVSGNYGVAVGQHNIITSTNGTAIGLDNTVSGQSASALGHSNTASGTDAVATGKSTTASGQSSFSSGELTKATSTYSASFNYQTEANGSASAAFGNLSKANGQYSFVAGNGSTTNSSGNAAIAMGDGCAANGNGAVALGKTATASAESAMALGFTTIASGQYSAALGDHAKATATSSTAIGYTSFASGQNAIAIGRGATANATDAIAIGFGASNNGNQGSFALADGQSGGVLNTATFQFASKFTNGYYMYSNNNNGTFMNDQQFRPLNDGAMELGTSGNRWNHVYAQNGLLQTSDIRFKKNIENMTYGLNTIMKLRPVTYNWKSGDQERKIGFIAQELKEVVPEVVHVGSDKDQTLGVNYAELTSVLVKAVQEQQKQIEALTSQVEILKATTTKN